MIKVKREPRDSKHKFSAFLPNGKRVRFGAQGYSDFTLHGDPERMKRYLRRHGAQNIDRIRPTITNLLRVKRSSKEDWSPRGVATAGFWSRWLLWSHPTLEKAAQTTSRVVGRRIVLL